MFFLDVHGLSAAWQYAIRTAVCGALFLAFRPWRWYPRLSLRHVPLSLLIGVFIFFVWVGPESETMGRIAPTLKALYVKYCVGFLGLVSRDVPEIPPYSPAVCGWPLAIVRLIGSAFVIAFIEEFAFRGFLYRWAIRGDNFLKIDPGTVDGTMFLLVAATFALEHNEWVAGLVCGLAYGWLFIQTRDIWAAGLAHMTTNLLLALYVFKTGQWQFW